MTPTKIHKNARTLGRTAFLAYFCGQCLNIRTRVFPKSQNTTKKYTQTTYNKY